MPSTDGACSGNPGPGGWGALLAGQGKAPPGKSSASGEFKGGEAHTRPTTGWSLLAGDPRARGRWRRPATITVVTDSAYVKGRHHTNGSRDGSAKGWKKRGTSNEKGGKAREERGPLASPGRGRAAPQGDLDMVKGHAGHPENRTRRRAGRSRHAPLSSASSGCARRGPGLAAPPRVLERRRGGDGHTRAARLGPPFSDRPRPMRGARISSAPTRRRIAFSTLAAGIASRTSS